VLAEQGDFLSRIGQEQDVHAHVPGVAGEGANQPTLDLTTASQCGFRQDGQVFGGQMSGQPSLGTPAFRGSFSGETGQHPLNVVGWVGRQLRDLEFSPY